MASSSDSGSSVTTSIRQPEGLSNKTPSLVIRWDAAKLGITGRDLARHLYTTEPRIALPTGFERGQGSETGISIVPYMMAEGDEKIVATRIAETLANPPKVAAITTDAPSGDLTGRWDVRIDYLASTSEHVLHLKQNSGGRVEGTHQGDFVSRDLGGTLEGDRVRLNSSYTERHGDSLMFDFQGKLTGDEMSGTLSMGEYLEAKWTAQRHQFRRSA